MTWGKEPQGPVGPSEAWKELVRPRPDGAICTVALGDLQALLESARTRPGCGAAERSMRFLSCATRPVTGLGGAGRQLAVAQGGRAVPWRGAWLRGQRPVSGAPFLRP